MLQSEGCVCCLAVCCHAESGVFAVKPEMERLKHELKVLRAAVDAALAMGGSGFSVRAGRLAG